MFTSAHVYLCSFMFNYVYHRWLVFSCLSLLICACFTMITQVYSCLLCTYVYLFLPLFTCVYQCLLMFTYVYHVWLMHVHLCLPMFTRVYLRLLLFTYVYSFLLVFAIVCHSLVMITCLSLFTHACFTYVYPCLPTFTHAYLCLPRF